LEEAFLGKVLTNKKQKQLTDPLKPEIRAKHYLKTLNFCDTSHYKPKNLSTLGVEGVIFHQVYFSQKY
jgi:hypothetical protein